MQLAYRQVFKQESLSQKGQRLDNKALGDSGLRCNNEVSALGAHGVGEEVFVGESDAVLQLRLIGPAESLGF